MHSTCMQWIYTATTIYVLYTVQYIGETLQVDLSALYFVSICFFVFFVFSLFLWLFSLYIAVCIGCVCHCWCWPCRQPCLSHFRNKKQTHTHKKKKRVFLFFLFISILYIRRRKWSDLIGAVPERRLNMIGRPCPSITRQAQHTAGDRTHKKLKKKKKYILKISSSLLLFLDRKRRKKHGGGLCRQVFGVRLIFQARP